MQRTSLLVGVFVALLLVAGCKKDEGMACFTRDACAEGLACVGDGLRRCEKCEGLKECSMYGKCSAKDGICVSASDADCKRSYDCKERGPCTAKNGECVVGSDADCRQSQSCAKDKYCIAQGNNCVRGPADRQSAADGKSKGDAPRQVAVD